MPGEGFFVWKKDTPFTLHGINSLLPGCPGLQEV
jgi:hypothetical protein